MKKFFCLGIFVIMYLSVNAQNQGNEPKPYYFYCEMTANKAFTKLIMSLEWNDKWLYPKIYDKNGNKINFKTNISMLNYMSKIGWEVVQTYYVTEGRDHVVRYLLRKLVFSDEEAKKGLFGDNDIDDKK